MCTNLIMMSTTTNTTVLSDSVLPLVNINRRVGNTLTNSVNSISLNRPGYYKVNAVVTFTAPAAGTSTITAQKDGVNVTGITASTTITTADTEVRSLALSGIIRVFCNEGPSTLTLVNTGVEITTSNVEIDVEYLG